MLITPDTVTDDWASATAGAASAPATATARSFFCIRMLPSVDHLAALARHPGNPVLLGLSGILRRGVGVRNEIEARGGELQAFVATSQQIEQFNNNLLIISEEQVLQSTPRVPGAHESFPDQECAHSRAL